MPATELNANLGDPLRMVFGDAEKGLPLQQRVGEILQGLVSLSSYLSVSIFLLQNITRPAQLFYFLLKDKVICQ